MSTDENSAQSGWYDDPKWTFIAEPYNVGKVWTFGTEVWCNIPGRYVHIVAPTQPNEIAICSIGVMGPNEDLTTTVTIGVPTQTDPSDYSYTNPTSFKAEYTYSPSEYDVTIEYSCSTPDSEPAWCSAGNFNSATGEWNLPSMTSAQDKIDYPPGDYQITVTGIGKTCSGETVSSSYIFNLKVLDPCSFASVVLPTLTQPSDYSFDGSTSFSASFTPSELNCSIEYSCSPLGGSTIDWCTVGTFN